MSLRERYWPVVPDKLGHDAPFPEALHRTYERNAAIDRRDRTLLWAVTIYASVLAVAMIVVAVVTP